MLVAMGDWITRILGDWESSLSLVVACSGSQDSSSEQREVRSPVHGPLHELEPVGSPFYLTIASWEEDGSEHRVAVTAEPGRQ